MVKKKTTVKKRSKPGKKSVEPDSLFFLKLVVLLIVASQWIYIHPSNSSWQIPIPFGLILGLVLVTHEHFQIDRKIEYAILIIASFIAFWLPVGLVLEV